MITRAFWLGPGELAAVLGLPFRALGHALQMSVLGDPVLGLELALGLPQTRATQHWVRHLVGQLITTRLPEQLILGLISRVGFGENLSGDLLIRPARGPPGARRDLRAIQSDHAQRHQPPTGRTTPAPGQRDPPTRPGDAPETGAIVAWSGTWFAAIARNAHRPNPSPRPHPAHTTPAPSGASQSRKLGGINNA